MSNRKQRVFNACTIAAKTGERIPLEGMPSSAFQFIRVEVMAWNKANPPWECALEKSGVELIVVPIVGDDTASDANGLRAVLDTTLGGDGDSVARGHYDRTATADVVVASEPFNRKRVTDAVALWNEQKRGDVVVRKYAGRWVFYRRQWLKGRDFYRAIETWLSCQPDR